MATSHFATKALTYLEDNVRYNLATDSPITKKHKPSSTVSDMSYQVHENLLQSLGHNIGYTCVDVASNITSFSPHTGDGDASCGSTLNLTNATNRVLKTKYFAIQFANAWVHLADSWAQLLDLKTKQME